MSNSKMPTFRILLAAGRGTPWATAQALYPSGWQKTLMDQQ